MTFNSNIDRRGLANEWKNNYKKFKEDASNNKMTLAGYLNEISPAVNENDKPNAIHDLMAAKGLRMKDIPGVPSSLVEDFKHNEADLALLSADLQEYYEKGFTINHDRRASIGSLPAGSPMRPFDEQFEGPRKRSGMRLRLNQIIAESKSNTNVDGRITELVLPDPDKQMLPKAPGAEPKIAKVGFGTRKYTLKQVALAIEFTYQFARENQIRAAALRDWADEIQINHEIGLVRDGLRTVLSDAPINEDGTQTQSIKQVGAGSGNAKHYSVETLSELLFELDGDYVADTFVGGPVAVSRFLQIGLGNSNLLLSDLDQAPDLQARFRTLNNGLLIPEQWAAYKTDIRPVTDTVTDATQSDTLAVDQNQLLFFDSTKTLGYVTLIGGDLTESHQDPLKQLFYEILSRYYEFYVKKLDSRMKVYFQTS